MSETNETILSTFYTVCGQILCGKATEAEIKASTKAMVDSGQQKIMAEEFGNIHRTLRGD